MASCRSLLSARQNRNGGWPSSCLPSNTWLASYEDACAIRMITISGTVMNGRTSDVIAWLSARPCLMQHVSLEQAPASA